MYHSFLSEAFKLKKRAKLGTFAKPQLTTRPPSKLGTPYLVFCGIKNGLIGTIKVFGTSDPLDQTPAPLFGKSFALFFSLKASLCAI